MKVSSILTSKFNNTPFQIAVQKGNNDIINFLKEKSLDKSWS